MSLKEEITKDLREALKKEKKVELSALRMLQAAILNREKEKRAKLAKGKEEIKEEELAKESQLTDEEIIEVISSEVKKRKEAILEFSAYAEGYGGPAEARPLASEGGEKGEKGKIESFIEREKAEIEILEKYLPEQLSEESIEKLAKKVIEKIGAKEPKDMGKVMAELMPKVKGRAEGRMVSKIVQELLTLK